MQRSRGTGPRATGKNASSSRRARACPSPCSDRGGQAPALREKTPPLHRRARACPSPCVLLSNRIPPVVQDRLILIRSRSGDLELQRWARCLRGRRDIPVPIRNTSRPGGLSYRGRHRDMKHPLLITLQCFRCSCKIGDRRRAAPGRRASSIVRG